MDGTCKLPPVFNENAVSMVLTVINPKTKSILTIDDGRFFMSNQGKSPGITVLPDNAHFNMI
jgi:hypothetical protein